MALSSRERNLAVVTGSLLALVVVWFMVSALTAPIRDRKAQIQAAEEKLEQQKFDIKRAEKSQRKLTDWRARAMPADLDLAMSLYKNWLLELTTSVGLNDTKVDPLEVRVGREVYRLMPFSVHGRGSLDELVDFLWKFYSKGYLHRIKSLTVKPREKSGDLELTISIEALSLPEAVSTDALPEAPTEWLADADRVDFNAITERNLFEPSRPPRPPVVQRDDPAPPRDDSPPTAPPSFDPGKYAFITAIVKGLDGRLQIWLKSRTTGQMLTLAEGDDFELGTLQGTVVEIHQRTAELEIDGQRCLIALGKSLREPLDAPE